MRESCWPDVLGQRTAAAARRLPAAVRPSIAWLCMRGKCRSGRDLPALEFLREATASAAMAAFVPRGSHTPPRYPRQYFRLHLVEQPATDVIAQQQTLGGKFLIMLGTSS